MVLKKFATFAILGVSSIALSACLTIPGEFASEAVINADGSYAFTYSGDIQVITMAMIMQESMKAESSRQFTPYCYGPAGSSMSSAATVAAVEYIDETSAAAEAAADAAVAAASAADAAIAAGEDPYAQRDCSAEELAAQKAEFDATTERQKQEAKDMQAMLGGIDPTDPATIAEFSERLERQRGWESVDWVKGGTFKVVYKTSGTLNDNFGFPLIADMPTGQPFLTITRWDNNSVQVSAPGFLGGQGMGTGSMGMMAAIFGGGGESGGPSTKEMDELGIKPLNGTFTVRTNGTIKTNNTETGPSDENGMQVMRWKVNADSKMGTPTTLIQL